MHRRSLRDLKPEERAILEEGKPKPVESAADRKPLAAPVKEPTQLVAYRWPVSLVRSLMEECHRRKMEGVEPNTQREITAEAVRQYLKGQAK